MIKPATRIFDTGTRRPDPVPDGVELVHQPALIRRELSVERDRLSTLESQPHHLVFYSRYAVETVAERGLIEASKHHRFWAVGSRTAEGIEARFDTAVDVPDDQHFTGLKEALADCDEPLPITAFGLRGTDRDLGDIASGWGVDFTPIPVYESVPQDPDELAAAFDEFEPHWLCVTSSRGVRAVVDALDVDRLQALQSLERLGIAAIGPSTAATLAEFELSTDAIPDEPDRAELLRIIAP